MHRYTHLHCVCLHTLARVHVCNTPLKAGEVSRVHVGGIDDLISKVRSAPGRQKSCNFGNGKKVCVCYAKTCFLLMQGVLVCIQHSGGVRTGVEPWCVTYDTV